MSILSVFKGSKLRISWRFGAGADAAIIWKLLISAEGILCGEVRDTELKQATLFALEVSGGKVLWRDASIGEAWWFNSERATREVIFIQKFRKPDMPEPKGIVAVDLHTGLVRWEQPDLAMLSEAGGTVYAQREAYGMKEYVTLDAGTGEVLSEVRSPMSEVRSLESGEIDIHSVYSVAITPEDELFGEIAGALSAQHSALSTENLRGTIDFAEYGKYIVYSYHEKSDVRSPKHALSEANVSEVSLPIFGAQHSVLSTAPLRHHLKVLDKERGEIVYSDEPNASTPYPVPENFFIHRGVLIYVKEKREIIGVELG